MDPVNSFHSIQLTRFWYGSFGPLMFNALFHLLLFQWIVRNQKTDKIKSCCNSFLLSTSLCDTLFLHLAWMLACLVSNVTIFSQVIWFSNLHEIYSGRYINSISSKNIWAECMRLYSLSRYLSFSPKKREKQQRKWSFCENEWHPASQLELYGKPCDTDECINYVEKWKMCKLTLFYEQLWHTLHHLSQRCVFLCSNFVRVNAIQARP